MTVMDDFVVEALRLQGILGLLTQAQWQAESGADGWSVADVVLHLAQSDEAVAASADGADHRADVAGAGTVLDGDLLDQIDAIVAPGTELNPLDNYYTNPDLADHRRRRR